MSEDVIALPRESVRHLFDLVICSVDFGSGFLDDEDIDLLRTIAVELGVDPWEATPSDWRHKYPHPFEPLRAHYRSADLPPPDRCRFCGKPEALSCHAEATA